MRLLNVNQFATMKAFFAVLTLWLSIQIGLAQPVEYEVPQIIPSNPTAAAFARYDEIPVDPSTGVPQIQIPLYTIQSHKLQVPLVLSYHASGIKVNDISTPVGLGWVISGMTGLVSRTVVDRPDEDYFKYGNNTFGRAKYPSEQSYQTKLNQVGYHASSAIVFGSELNWDLTARDKLADRFNYQLPGSGSGMFSYDFDTDELVLKPYKPVDIVRVLNENIEIASFTVTDEQGNKYTFDKPYRSLQSFVCTHCYNGTANSSWYLTKIETADGTDQIEYQYNNFINSYSLGYYSDSYVASIYDADYYYEGKGDINLQMSESYRNHGFTTTQEPLLYRIVSATSIVEFEYANDRKDWDNAKYRLSAIKVLDKITQEVVRTITLDNNQYFGSGGHLDERGNRRLKLNGVTISDPNGGNTYTFDYEGGDMPAYNSLERINFDLAPPSFSEDFWGYYNGKANNGLVPVEFIQWSYITSYPQYGGNRRPDHNKAKAYMLRKISYPTGGTTTFEFGPNIGHFAIGSSGGFKVDKIISSSDGITPSTVKSYEYHGYYIPHQLNSSLFSYWQQYNWDFEACGDTPGIPNASPGQGADDPVNLIYRLTTTSSSFSPLNLSNGASVLYTRVYEYHGTGSPQHNNTGRILYQYAEPQEYPLGYSSIPENWTRDFGSYWYDNGGYVPQLLNKRVEKWENGVYSPVSETINNYQVFLNEEYSGGVNMIKNSYEIKPTGVYNDIGYLIGQNCNGYIPGDFAENVLFCYLVGLKDQVISPKVSLLTKTEQRQYNGSDYISTITEYAYDNLDHLQPTSVSVSTSDNSVLRTEFKYPSDFSSQSPYSEMLARNIVTPVIEQKLYKGTQTLSSKKTNYTSWGNNIIAPETVEGKIGDGPNEVRIRFNGYDDKGNILSVSKENDVVQSYLWGYNQTLPIAVAFNAKTGDWFHTSFEDNQGNLSGGKTGDKAFTGSYTKALSGLTNGQYTLSYWKKTGNNWLLEQSPVNVTTNSYTINLSGILDEIRFHPANAHMTTNTYRPLIGITSITDQANQTTYYEYDYAARLSVTRDNKRDITTKINYAYSGNPEEPISGAFYNNLKTGQFTPINCSTGYTGKQYLYVVHPGKHYSLSSQEEADQLALEDVNANGQMNANLYGECIPAYTNAQQAVNFVKNNCESGFTGTSVTYTVYAGKHRATTQEAADQMVVDDIASNGQNFANSMGSCYNPSWPFVSLAFENPTTQTVPNGSGVPFENYYQDVVIRFYADKERTIPANVTNLPIKLRRNWYSGSQYGIDYPVFLVSGSSAVLYDDLLFWGYDANGNFIEEQFTVEADQGYNIVH